MTPIAPAKMSLICVDRPAVKLVAQFNPTEVRESLTPVWAAHRVTGLSHPVKHYSFTEERKISFNLEFNADVPGGNLETVRYARRFLLANSYNWKGAQNIVQGQPSRLLFKWPRVMSLTTHIADIDTVWEGFNYAGDIIRYTAKVSLAEIRDVRLYADDVLFTMNDSVIPPEL